MHRLECRRNPEGRRLPRLARAQLQPSTTRRAAGRRWQWSCGTGPRFARSSHSPLDSDRREEVLRCPLRPDEAALRPVDAIFGPRQRSRSCLRYGKGLAGIHRAPQHGEDSPRSGLRQDRHQHGSKEPALRSSVIGQRPRSHFLHGTSVSGDPPHGQHHSGMGNGFDCASLGSGSSEDCRGAREGPSETCLRRAGSDGLGVVGLRGRPHDARSERAHGFVGGAQPTRYADSALRVDRSPVV